MCVWGGGGWVAGARENKGGKGEERERDAGVMRGRQAVNRRHFLVLFNVYKWHSTYIRR
jgi:hypothetical protein